MAKSTRITKSSSAKPQEDYEDYYACQLPEVQPRPLPETLDPSRMELIRVNEKKWVNGTTLHYYFFDRPSDGPNGSWVGQESQKRVVRDTFKEWKDLGIGLNFVEASEREDAEVRIGFQRGGGSWSYVGRDVIDLVSDPNRRTMNFGWDLTTSYGRDTARHEIGHTLGFPHAHQNPNAGIDWDEQAVYNYFRGGPNFWSDAKTDFNILRKLSQAEVAGSEWDPDSIMQYSFPAGLIESPAQYRAGLRPKRGLSATDIEWVQQFYPPIEKVEERELKPFEGQRIVIGPGEQINFRIRPQSTRNYSLQTFGESDTVIVLFETFEGETSFVDGDDDSGFERNAKIKTRLYRNHDYMLKVKLYYALRSGETAVLLW